MIKDEIISLVTTIHFIFRRYNALPLDALPQDRPCNSISVTPGHCKPANSLWDKWTFP